MLEKFPIYLRLTAALPRQIRPAIPRYFLIPLAALILIFGSSQPVQAQGSGAAAGLTGQVLDASGAAMAGASLTLEEINTGARRSATSNNEGLYYLQDVPPGDYRLTATAAGFVNTVISPIHLDVKQAAKLDVTMGLGTVAQSVEVVGSALRLDSQTAEVSPTMPPVLVTELPTSFRNPVELVGMLPGVTQVNTFGGNGNSPFNATATWGRSNFTMAGGFPNTTAFLVDGVDAGHSYSPGGMGMNVIISPDTVDEFKLHMFDYTAEFGNGNGAMNIITKSGTNTVHGSASYFLQNTALNANDFFNSTRGAPRPFEIRHQFDGTIGGPVYIPKVYDGRNRTFFYVDFGELRQPNTSIFLARVPTAAERTGDFSNEYSTSGAPITLYNPFSTFTSSNGVVMRNVFPNNQIPQSLIAPFATTLMNYYPQPNRPGGTLGPGGVPTNQNNFYATPPNNFILEEYDIKIDEMIKERHRFTLRISKNPQPLSCLPVSQSTYGTAASPDQCFSQSPSYDSLSYTFTKSPTMLLTASYYLLTSPFYSYSPGDNFDFTQLGGPYNDPNLVNYLQTHFPHTRFPNISLSGYGAMGGTANGGGIQDTPYGYNVALTKFRGNHSFKFGGQGYQRRILDAGTISTVASGGSFAFNGMFTQGPNPLVPAANTGNALADMELGLLSGGNVSPPSIERHLFSTYYAWFFQDDWRVTPKLTLNLGLRYDFELSSREPDNYISVFDARQQNPLGNQVGPNTDGQTLNQFLGRTLMGGMVFGGSPQAGGSSRPALTDMTAVAPRLGAAYQLTNRIVIRGGAGKLYWPTTSGAHDNGECPSCTASTSIVASIDGIHPAVSITNPYPGGLLEPVGPSAGLLADVGHSLSTDGVRYAVTPYVWQWNFNIEASLPSNTLLSVSYAGNRGRHLPCPTGLCGDQLNIATAQQLGSSLLQTVNNPFYGIVTDPTSALSKSTVQLRQLYFNWPEFTGGSITFPQVSSQQGFPFFNEAYPFKSSWNALLVSVEKRYSNGLQFSAAYTLSKQMSNADSFVGWLGNVAQYQNLYNLAGERSISAQDVPQRFVLGHAYDLPFGHGKSFGANMPSVLNAIVGGWQFSGMLTLQEGTPLPISATPNNSGTGFGTLRPNLLSTPTLTSGSLGARLQQWVNPAAFALPAPFTYGNAPRTLNIRSDGQQVYNLNLAKNFPIKERVHAEFRWEFFNLFNHPNFAAPNMSFGSPTFGVVSATALPPRFIQVGLRILW